LTFFSWTFEEEVFNYEVVSGCGFTHLLIVPFNRCPLVDPMPFSRMRMVLKNDH
jgi:hypothetical protein